MDITRVNYAVRIFVATVAVAAVSACASGGKFSCPAQSTGYGCKSTLEVYEITNAPGVRDAKQEPVGVSRRAKRRQAMSVEGHNAHGVGIEGQAMALEAPVQHDMGAFIAPASLSLGPAHGPHIPHDSDTVARLPAQVMRIWVAPWTDERGDLHRPSHIYTEIVARRWAVGGDVRADDGVRASFDPNGPMFPNTTP